MIKQNFYCFGNLYPFGHVINTVTGEKVIWQGQPARGYDKYLTMTEIVMEDPESIDDKIEKAIRNHQYGDHSDDYNSDYE